MTNVNKSALIKVSATRMFNLVNDIESYPEFLPWCSDSKILAQDGDIVEAELTISKAGFKKTFSTRNQFVGENQLIISLLNGPFSSLDGIWNFIPLRDDASKISLDLDFEMNGKFTSLAFGAVFNQICNTMVSSFTGRAKQLYGQ
ncbi:MAG: type II toxin-antitoxin system RatA family toxin [Methylococcales bacterium]|nr:type II toxin-antitoxin system RatA family toxin [Methylococcales bacterium]